MRRNEAVFMFRDIAECIDFYAPTPRAGQNFLKYLLPIVCRDSRKGCPYELQKTRITAKFAG